MLTPTRTATSYTGERERAPAPSVQPASLFLVIKNPVLRSALERTLAPRFAVSAGLHPADDHESIRLVLATPADLKPAECADVARHGHLVVILAALPHPSEEARYTAAGVRRYLPMGLERDLLEQELLRVSHDARTG